MKIPRYYQDLTPYINPNKALVIIGPRRVGKTTLLKDYLEKQKGKIRYKLESGDDIITQELIGSSDFARIKKYAAGYDLIAIDEAQKIKNVGQGLKIIVDEIPGIKIITTGSSSFELAGQFGEPLTGRKITLTLYPVSQIELKNLHNDYELKNRLEEY